MDSSIEPEEQPGTESRVTADSDKWEPNIKAALEAIEEGRMSYRQARDAYGISVTTLTRRRNGAKPRHEVQLLSRKMTPAMEDSVVHWTLWERRNNRPPTQAQVRQYAQHVCDVSGLSTKIGKNWLDRFIPRHPELLESGPSGSKWQRGQRRPNKPRREASAEDSGEAAEVQTPLSREENVSASQVTP
ncbi:hypothetical protein DHEL01_v204779 [Diaporthe helianthi]|uniref:HTH CENPB-type domain-containing protein n=1 Tax=Diaporthe helianthi TaxID=158607 RepID=A0A2P5I2X6_DIAHE|nr:hypothetical protein DHEL01_v204779 [Diaporthe helianthi]